MLYHLRVRKSLPLFDVTKWTLLLSKLLLFVGIILGVIVYTPVCVVDLPVISSDMMILSTSIQIFIFQCLVWADKLIRSCVLSRPAISNVMVVVDHPNILIVLVSLSFHDSPVGNLVVLYLPRWTKLEVIISPPELSTSINDDVLIFVGLIAYSNGDDDHLREMWADWLCWSWNSFTSVTWLKEVVKKFLVGQPSQAGCYDPRVFWHYSICILQENYD